MVQIVNTDTRRILVKREETDPVFGKNESWLLHHVKKALQAMGYDCIKKRAWKDGHMVDDNMQYIRDRKGRWFVYDNDYNVRNLAEEFTRNGEVALFIMTEGMSGGLVK